MSVTEKFGKRLRELRKKKNISQESIAYSADLSVYYISRLERGMGNPSLETLTKIAKALKISLSELLKDL